MAYRKPYDLYDSILSDQAMMEEVLELLGSDSTSTGHEKKLTATFNNNRDAVCNEVANENELLGWDEEKYPRKQEQDLPRDQTQSTMESLIRPSTPMHLTEAASKSPSLLPQQFFHGAVPQPFSAEPCFVNFTAAPESRQSLRAPVQENMIVRETVTADPIPISPPASILHHTLQDSQPLSKSATLVTHLNSESNVLPTGQRIRVINPDEFEELRRKVQMQTASRRYRKRKKEAARYKKMHVQELQKELSRLQYMEAQTKQYQQRSVESLQQELKMHQAEVADLSGKIEDATRKELDWIAHLPL